MSADCYTCRWFIEERALKDTFVLTPFISRKGSGDTDAKRGVVRDHWGNKYREIGLPTRACASTLSILCNAENQAEAISKWLSTRRHWSKATPRKNLAQIEQIARRVASVFYQPLTNPLNRGPGKLLVASRCDIFMLY